MPELPEVETTCCGIAPHLTHKIIQKIIIRNARLRWPVPQNLSTVLKNAEVKQVTRRAKYLLIATNKGTVIIHLGMSGSLRITAMTTPPEKHDHIDFVLNNGTCLRLKDPRRFGAVLWTREDPLRHPLLFALGLEPLNKQFTARYLWQQAQGRKIAVKLLIMNAAIVVGVGNIYANEALFAAKIHPLLASNQLTFVQCQALVAAIKKVLRQAIKAGGTTLKDFTQSDGKPGYFKQQLQVYGREKEPCYHCEHVLQHVIIGQRTTVFCPYCQKR